MGGFLTIGYCFPYCFLETFVGGQGLDGGEKVVMGIPQLGKTLSAGSYSQVFTVLPGACSFNYMSYQEFKYKDKTSAPQLLYKQFCTSPICKATKSQCNRRRQR